MLCLFLLLVLMLLFFPFLFSSVIILLLRERVGLYASHVFVVVFSCIPYFLSFFPSSWHKGLTAACDWNFP